jgi:hypothetical protein
MDADAAMWSISVTKDGLTCDNNFENSTGKFSDLISLLNSKTGSVVINNNAELIGSDLDQTSCFTFFRSLITR